MNLRLLQTGLVDGSYSRKRSLKFDDYKDYISRRDDQDDDDVDLDFPDYDPDEPHQNAGGDNHITYILVIMGVFFIVLCCVIYLIKRCIAHDDTERRRATVTFAELEDNAADDNYNNQTDLIFPDMTENLDHVIIQHLDLPPSYANSTSNSSLNLNEQTDETDGLNSTRLVNATDGLPPTYEQALDDLVDGAISLMDNSNNTTPRGSSRNLSHGNEQGESSGTVRSGRGRDAGT